jgi:hypothetical protein
MKRCGLITTGILAFISGVCSVVVGIIILVTGTNSLCEEAIYYNNNDNSSPASDGVDGSSEYPYHHFDITQRECNIGVNTFAGVAIGGGSLWLIIALFIFVFACGSRYDAFLMEREQADKDVVMMVQQNQITVPQQQPRDVTGVVTGENV